MIFSSKFACRTHRHSSNLPLALPQWNAANAIRYPPCIRRPDQVGHGHHGWPHHQCIAVLRWCTGGARALVCTHRTHQQVYEFGRKGQGWQNSTYHPMLMNWAITFLARTSASTYNEVAKIMMLLRIRTIYRKTAEHITTKNDKAYCLHMNTIQSISKRSHQESWTSHQRIGTIAQDSTNTNSGIEHDNVSNTLNGGNKSHSIATLSGMFCALAQKVKDTWCDEKIEPAASADYFAGVTGVHQN
jgi:hypothetical protein